MDTNNQADAPFKLGLVVATAEAALALAKSKTQPEQLLDRHARLDFGEVDQGRTDANLDAIKCGGRVASAYLLATGDVVLVVTEKGSTTLLTPPGLDQPWE
jgi:hypothetical protein